MRASLAFALAAASLACSADPSLPPTNGAHDASADVAPADVAPADVAPADVARDAAPPRLRVLFVGNSYTYVNDLPALITRMATASGSTIETVGVTVGGATLRNHWETNDAPVRIMMGGWDAVVLQEQSVTPALNPAEFRDYAARFGRLAIANGARAVFYATWPRRAGDAVYAESWSGASPAALNARLDSAYTAAAMTVGGSVAHAGNAWMRALDAYPAINLYADDGSHPSPAATWLVGCVMYRALTGSPPVAATDAAAMDVTPADARSLRELAASLSP